MFKITEELLHGMHLNNLNYLRCQVNFLHYTCFNLNQPNFYDVLGVQRTASQKQIKDAYLKLCKLYHPDSANSDSILTKEDKIKKFQKISEAYRILSKSDSKIAYDRLNQTWVPPNVRNKPHENRTYPKRPDGYRPFSDSSPNDPFKKFYEYHKKYSSFDDFEESKKGMPEFKNFNEFRYFYGSRRKPKTEEEATSIKFFVFITFFIFFYILAVRIYVLRQYRHIDNYGNYDSIPVYQTKEENFVTVYPKNKRETSTENKMSDKTLEFPR